jgi:hypothetical protein
MGVPVMVGMLVFYVAEKVSHARARVCVCVFTFYVAYVLAVLIFYVAQSLVPTATSSYIIPTFYVLPASYIPRIVNSSSPRRPQGMA